MAHDLVTWIFRLAVGHLEPLKTAENAILPLELLVRDKSDNTSSFSALLRAIKSSHNGAIVGALLKEEPKGAFATSFREAVSAEQGLQQVEIAPALAELLAVKDSTELACIKRASIFSAVVMQKYLVNEIETVVDADKKISHEQLAANTEDAFSDPSKLGVKLSADLLESCYTPIIQSGGNFNLKPTAASNGDNLYFGAVLSSKRAAHPSSKVTHNLMCGRCHHMLTWSKVQIILL